MLILVQGVVEDAARSAQGDARRKLFKGDYVAVIASIKRIFIL